MLDLIAKGYNGETPVYLYRLGNYKYEIEKKPNPYFSESEVFAAGYIEALKKMEEVVDDGVMYHGENIVRIRP